MPKTLCLSPQSPRHYVYPQCIYTHIERERVCVVCNVYYSSTRDDAALVPVLPHHVLVGHRSHCKYVRSQWTLVGPAVLLGILSNKYHRVSNHTSSTVYCGFCKTILRGTHSFVQCLPLLLLVIVPSKQHGNNMITCVFHATHTQVYSRLIPRKRLCGIQFKT